MTKTAYKRKCVIGACLVSGGELMTHGREHGSRKHSPGAVADRSQLIHKLQSKKGSETGPGLVSET